MCVIRRLSLVVGAVALYLTPSLGQQPGKLPKSDILVSDIQVDGDDLIVEVQNQGPAKFKKGKCTVSLEVFIKNEIVNKVTGKTTFSYDPMTIATTVPLPEEVKATETIKIPLAKNKIKDSKSVHRIIATLDPKNVLAEERKINNIRTWLSWRKPDPNEARGDYTSDPELPDLVITDITQAGPCFFVFYTNNGKGLTGADFSITLKANKRRMDGSTTDRLLIPPPGETKKLFGYSREYLGIKEGDNVEIEAIVDFEDRVRETDEKNNSFKKVILIK